MGYKNKVAASRGNTLKSCKGTQALGKLQPIPDKFIDNSKEEHEQQHSFLRRHYYYIIAAIIISILTYVVVDSINSAIRERRTVNYIQPLAKERNTYFYQVVLKSLNVDQIDKRFRLIFYNIDLNEDNQLDKVELQEWARRSFRVYAQTKSNQEFTRIDTNSDGFVSWKEISSFLLKVNDQNEVEGSSGGGWEDFKGEGERKTIDDFKDCFLIADSNADTLLDSSEFITCSQPEETVATTRHALYISKVMNEEKGISKPDKVWNFMKGLKIKYGSNSKEYKLHMNIYKKADSNSNGVLEEDEMTNLAFPSNLELADELVAYLIKTIDLDLNGKISGNEVIRESFELFNSKFTRYGRDLMEFDFDDK